MTKLETEYQESGVDFSDIFEIRASAFVRHWDFVISFMVYFYSTRALIHTATLGYQVVMIQHTSLKSLYAGVCLVVFSGSVHAQKPLILEGHTNVISGVAFSADGKRVISSSWDKTLRIWDINNRTEIATLSGHRDWVFACSLSADGTRLISASQHAIRTWNPETFSEQNVQSPLGGAVVNAVAVSADGSLVATGRRDGFTKLWQTGSKNPKASFGGFESWVSSVAIARDNKTLATGTRTGRIRLFDLTTNKERVVINGHAEQQLLALAINPACDTLASGGFDKTIRLWDLSTGKANGTLSGHKGIITAIAWSADGKLLATGERHGKIKLWNIAEGNTLVTTLAGHSDKRLGFSVTALAFSADGKRLVSGGYDKVVKVWDVVGEK